MRIPDPIIKSVSFVSRFEVDLYGEARPLQYGGTAFVVGVKVAEGAIYSHLVTAKHVADAIWPGEAVFAFNGLDGIPYFLRTGDQKWFFHPTEPDAVDVAVMPLGSARLNKYDLVWIPEQIFATPQRISEYSIGLGDELVIIGLFTAFYGSTQLVPIVRTGNVAMMPPDRVPVKGFDPMEVYLAEGRSIGGLSGSPVFVRNTVNYPAQDAKGNLAPISGLGALHFLGLMHGHWDLPTSLEQTKQYEVVNMGISIITPAKKILETLYHPELVAMRKEHYEKSKKDKQTTSDSAFKPFSKDDFEAALTKAPRKTS